MADRKQTPDVLADVLGGAAPQQAPAPEPSEERKPNRRTSPRKRTPRSAKKENWEYLLVSFQEYKGWRPRFVNGQEVTDWMSAPVIHEYVNQLGEEGWELTGASSGQSMYGLTDRRQMYFKRLKK
jgi:hypothetical protein